ncbi:hypothetical protein [Calothrix sp. NIES-2098]|nr:hypothetical protein NIES2098_05180 [Calothrix sp. NIES-2098]
MVLSVDTTAVLTGYHKFLQITCQMSVEKHRGLIHCNRKLAIAIRVFR